MNRLYTILLIVIGSLHIHASNPENPQEVDWNKALITNLNAYQSKAEAEPLYEIANHYHQIGKDHLATLHAKAAKRLNDISEKPQLEHQVNELLYLSAYHTFQREDGFSALNDILLSKDCPKDIKDRARLYSIHYVQGLPGTYFRLINLSPPVHKPTKGRFNLSSATIMKTDEGYDVICRTVNYRNSGGNYSWIDNNDHVVRTRNLLGKLDKSLNLISQNEIIEDLDRVKVKRSDAVGLEDCRAVKWNNETWFTCVTTDTNPSGACQESLCKLKSESKNGITKVEKLIPLLGPDPKRFEKNWLPFVLNNEIQLVYSYDPFIIYKPDTKSGELQEVVKYTPEHDFTHFRGSAAPIEFENGYLLMIHEVVRPDVYYFFHRFLYLDKDFKVQKISKPFAFLQKGVEYCCGMVIDHSGNNLIMSVSKEDAESYLVTLNVKDLKTILEPLPKVRN